MVGASVVEVCLHTEINQAILYPGECDLMIHTQECSVILSRMRFVTFVRI